LNPSDTDGGDLALPRELKARHHESPIIVLGEDGADITFAVQVMKAGAVDFLPFPCTDDRLLAAVASATADVRTTETQKQDADRARACIAEMPLREREVLAGLLSGKTNKEMARDIGISPRTVESHRAHVMQRLGVQTLPEAVLMAAAAGLRPPPNPAGPDAP
jgi:FixJ family two-component response regulator